MIKVNYSCPRCMYVTSRKSRIVDHFNKTPCPLVYDGIELTDDIKKMIIAGSTIKKKQLPTSDQEQSQQPIQNNTNSFNTILYQHHHHHDDGGSTQWRDGSLPTSPSITQIKPTLFSVVFRMNVLRMNVLECTPPRSVWCCSYLVGFVVYEFVKLYWIMAPCGSTDLSQFKGMPMWFNGSFAVSGDAHVVQRIFRCFRGWPCGSTDASDITKGQSL